MPDCKRRYYEKFDRLGLWEDLGIKKEARKMLEHYFKRKYESLENPCDEMIVCMETFGQSSWCPSAIAAVLGCNVQIFMKYFNAENSKIRAAFYRGLQSLAQRCCTTMKNFARSDWRAADSLWNRIETNKLKFLPPQEREEESMQNVFNFMINGEEQPDKKSDAEKTIDSIKDTLGI